MNFEASGEDKNITLVVDKYNAPSVLSISAFKPSIQD